MLSQDAFMMVAVSNETFKQLLWKNNIEVDSSNLDQTMKNNLEFVLKDIETLHGIEKRKLVAVS